MSGNVGSNASVVIYDEGTYLPFEVIPHKVKRVLESGNRGELDIGGGFVFAGTVDDGC